MPPYLNNIEVWKSFWPIPASAVVLSLIIALLAGKCHERREYFFVILAFSMLGMVTGYLSGFSRAPALGTVLPAVLSLMGGIVVYIIGKNSTSRIIVSVTILAFALTLMIGAEWGAVMRRADEEFVKNVRRAERRADEEFAKSALYLKKRAVIEDEVNDFRRNLDLPPLSETKPKAQ
jgi:predicted neutral ceramidase superfamily lipid hydrolase